MDSGNSGSMQSSSGGGDDQDFDSSRGEIESISSFLKPSPNLGSISTSNPQFLTHQNTTFFDPQHTDNLDHAFTQSNDNNDLFWSRGLRFDHMNTYADFGNFTVSSSSPSRTTQNPASTQQGPSSSVPLPAASLVSDQLSAGVIKNPKKRTRASHRAPTTVLTTDTTNFRQMVQEFTGIPAAPFSASSPYNSRSLDLFSAAAAAALRSGSHLDTLGPLFPLRPSAHKVLSPFPSPSSSLPSLLNPTMIDSVVPTANIVSTTAAATSLGASATSNNSNNYPLLPSDHPFNLQTHSNQLQLGGNASMSLGSLSGFQSQETLSATAQVRDNDNLQKQ